MKHEVFLAERDSSLLRKIAKNRRCTMSHLIREGVMEWLARRSFLEDEERKAVGAPTLGELLEAERQRRGRHDGKPDREA